MEQRVTLPLAPFPPVITIPSQLMTLPHMLARHLARMGMFVQVAQAIGQVSLAVSLPILPIRVLRAQRLIGWRAHRGMILLSVLLDCMRRHGRKLFGRPCDWHRTIPLFQRIRLVL